MEGRAESLVLVIEDDRDLSDLVTLLLESDLNVRTAQAEEGELGLKMTVDLMPDLVLLDISLPKLSGLEVARRLKADPATQAIPLVALTSTSRSDVLAAGCDDHLGKPFELDELAAKTVEYLHRGRGSGALAQRPRS